MLNNLVHNGTQIKRILKITPINTDLSSKLKYSNGCSNRCFRIFNNSCNQIILHPIYVVKIANITIFAFWG